MIGLDDGQKKKIIHNIRKKNGAIMITWELDGKNISNVPMAHVAIVAKYKLCKGEQNNETTKTNHS